MRGALALVALLLTVLVGPSWSDEERGPPPLPPAARQIPWDRLDLHTAFLVRDVVAGAVLVHQVDGIWYRSRREVFDFLFAHPDFAANVARVLREGRYWVRETAAGYEADDGRGARGFFKPAIVDGDRRVFYLEGRYHRPLLPTLSGRLVLVLETVHRTNPGGASYAEARVTGFLRFDNAVLEGLARIALNLSKSLMDRRIRRFFRHVERVSERAYADPEGMAEELARQPDLPAERVAQFRQVLLAHRLPSWAEALGLRLTWAPFTLNPGGPTAR